jgi:hypothetical protein
MRQILSLSGVLLLLGSVTAIAQVGRKETPRPDLAPEVRLAQLVQASIVATHAYQILLAKTTGKGDPACYAPGQLTDRDLETLVEHHGRLLASDRSAMKAWTRGQPSKFEPARDLDPILGTPLRIPDNAPVNVFSAWLRQKSQLPLAHIRSIANLYQTVLEIDRDGDRLQEEFDFLIGLGLRVYVGQLDLPGTDEAFLETGRELEARTCPSPFDTSAAAWQIAGRKVWNWAERKLHIRDEFTVANELLREPEVSALAPAIRAMPAQRIAIIGHSFTMGAHWSSPSSFVPIVSTIITKQNPGVLFRQFEAGGLTASRALRNFYSEALAWKPDKVLLVVLTRREEDFDALRQIGEGLTRQGIRCLVFDNIHDPESQDSQVVSRFQKTAREAGITIIEVDRLLSAAPDSDAFLCLDGIHMKEPYHRLMAKEWLEFLAGARAAQLQNP